MKQLVNKLLFARRNMVPPLHAKYSFVHGSLIVGACAGMCSLICIAILTSALPPQVSYAKIVAPEPKAVVQFVPLDKKNPVRIFIPRIHIDTAIESVGLTLQGAMDVTKGPSDVAWFNLGPRPGETGSAVINGHSGWIRGESAVFDNLHQLQNGDRIYITDAAGHVTTFVVRASRVLGLNDDATAIFTSHDGGAHLNLITCQGIWNKNSKSYNLRLVVFADKE